MKFASLSPRRRTAEPVADPMADATPKARRRFLQAGGLGALLAMARAPDGEAKAAAPAGKGRPAPPTGIERTSYSNPNLPPVPSLSWGLNIKNFTEMLFLSGHAAINVDNKSGRFPGDPVAQAKYTLEQLELTFAQAGYTRQDIVSVSWWATKEVTPEQTWAVAEVYGQYMADVTVKPCAGTWKHVDRLLSPDIQIEVEMILAR